MVQFVPDFNGITSVLHSTCAVFLFSGVKIIFTISRLVSLSHFFLLKLQSMNSHVTL